MFYVVVIKIFWENNHYYRMGQDIGILRDSKQIASAVLRLLGSRQAVRLQMDIAALATLTQDYVPLNVMGFTLYSCIGFCCRSFTVQ